MPHLVVWAVDNLDWDRVQAAVILHEVRIVQPGAIAAVICHGHERRHTYIAAGRHIGPKPARWFR